MKYKFIFNLWVISLIFFQFGSIYAFYDNSPNSQSESLSLRLSETNDESWTRKTQNGFKMQIDSENNVYVGGFVGDYDNAGITVSKYNSSGDIVWQEIWDNPGRQSLDYFTIDNFGDLYIAGNTNLDTLVLKYHSNGSLLWNLTIHIFHLIGFKVDSKSNLYLVSYYNQIPWGRDTRIMKYNSSGSKLWEIIEEISGNQYVNFIDFDSSENLFLSYETIEDNVNKWYFSKYDQFGNHLWVSEIPEIGELDSFKIHINEDVIILSGYNYSSSPFYVKFYSYNSTGFQVSNKFIFLSNSYRTYNDYIDKSGNYFLSSTNESGSLGVIAKYNESMEWEWSYYYYQPDFYTGSLIFDNKQNIYVQSEIDIPSEDHNDIYIIRLKENGSFISNLTWGANHWDQVLTSKFDSDNNYYLLIKSYVAGFWGSLHEIYYLVKNPIDNNKSLEPVFTPNFYDLYFIGFITTSSVISIISLIFILKPRIKGK